jgi:hypothetical protein
MNHSGEHEEEACRLVLHAFHRSPEVATVGNLPEPGVRLMSIGRAPADDYLLDSLVRSYLRVGCDVGSVGIQRTAVSTLGRWWITKLPMLLKFLPCLRE